LKEVKIGKNDLKNFFKVELTWPFIILLYVLAIVTTNVPFMLFCGLLMVLNLAARYWFIARIALVK